MSTKKTVPRYNIVKLLYDKEKILKANRKMTLVYTSRKNLKIFVANDKN